jgi:hypothetical protein
VAATVTRERTTIHERIPSPIRSFLAARQARPVFAAMILLGTLTAWLGTREASLPSLVAQGRAVIPLWRMLAMGAAVMPVISLQSRLADLEVVTTRSLRRLERLYMIGAGTGCAVIYLGISATTLHPLLLLVIARSWLAWFGLAVIAGVALGWRLAWTLPIALAAALWFWGMQNGGGYRWWEFSARPYDDVPSLVLSIGIFAAGLITYWATPWRRRQLREGHSKLSRHQTM